MDLEEDPLSPPPGNSPPSTPPAALAIEATNLAQRMSQSQTKPKLGGTVDGTIMWIGGPPNEAYDGPYCTKHPTPMCFRGMDALTEAKWFGKRISGSETKFKRDDPDFPLVAFADHALHHMQLMGMDTVFYMTGAKADGTGALDLFSYHTRFTKAQVEDHIKDKVAGGIFDDFQQASLKESFVWLTNSLDESLKASLRTKLALCPHGPVLWMMIVAEVQSNSLQRTENLVEQFKAMSLAQHKGEDVGKCADAAEVALVQLEKDEQLPRLHLMTIVNVFTNCSVWDFKVHWMGRRSEVSAFIKDSAGKAKSVVSAMSNRIHFRDLLDDGRDLHRELLEGKKWGPSGKGSASPETALHATIKQLNAKVAKLDQQLKSKDGSGGGTGGGSGGGNGDRGGSKRKCFRCGSTDHLANNCPKPPPNDSGNKDTPAPGTGKWAAPKDGEPHKKKIDGVDFFWCAKCRKGKGKWNKNHTTEQHQVGFLKDKKNEASNGSDNGSSGGAPAGHLASLTVCPPVSQKLFSIAQWDESDDE